MLTQLFTSKARIKVLLKLFLNPDVTCYLRELATEFKLSPNALKGELDSLSEAGYLTRKQAGRSIFFQANTAHPFFSEISSIVRKSLGIDSLLEEIMRSLGRIDSVYVLDDYAQGRDTGLIDLLVVGEVDHGRLGELVDIAERKISRKVRVMDVTTEGFERNREIFMRRPHWKVV